MSKWKKGSVEEWLNTPWPPEYDDPPPKNPEPREEAKQPPAEPVYLWPWGKGPRRWTVTPVGVTSARDIPPTYADELEEVRRANARAARAARRRADGGFGIWNWEETIDEMVARQNGDDE